MKTKCDLRLWPEGTQFTREVMIPTKYELLPVLVTFAVPAFEVVVAMWKNEDPEQAYPLFRQFIVDWDQEETLTDYVLMSYLYAFPGSDEAMMRVWADHMKKALAANQKSYSITSHSIN